MTTPPPPRPGLDELALRKGDRVRFRAGERGRWRTGVVAGRERDGSVGLHDDGGAFRAIEPSRLEVARPGRGTALRWEPLLVHAAHDEQLALFAPVAPADTRHVAEVRRRARPRRVDP